MDNWNYFDCSALDFTPKQRISFPFHVCIFKRFSKEIIQNVQVQILLSLSVYFAQCIKKFFSSTKRNNFYVLLIKKVWGEKGKENKWWKWCCRKSEKLMTAEFKLAFRRSSTTSLSPVFFFFSSLIRDFLVISMLNGMDKRR